MRRNLERSPNLLSPAILFMITWLTVIILVWARNVVRIRIDNSFMIVLLLNIFVAVLQILFFSKATTKPGYEYRNQRYMSSLFINIRWWFYFFIFLTIIVGIVNKGYPLIWVFLHNRKTYIDYSLASVTGFSQGIYSFIVLILSYLVFHHNHRKYRKILSVMLFFPVLIISRGLLMITLFQVFLVYLSSMRKKTSWRKVLIITIGVCSLMAIFSKMYLVRNGLKYTQLHDKSFGNTFYDSSRKLSFLPKSLVLGYIVSTNYIATPAENMFAAADKISPDYMPYWSLQTLIPSFIRSNLFKNESYASKYPIPLINPTYNATSAYSPFYADFGPFGAFLIMFSFQAIAMIWYNRRSCIRYYFLNIASCSFIVFSFFYPYFLALPFIFQMLLIAIHGKFFFIKKNTFSYYIK